MSRSVSRSPPPRRRSPSPRSSSKRAPARGVKVKGLSRNVERDHLEHIFAVYGDVRRIDLPVNPRSELDAPLHKLARC